MCGLLGASSNSPLNMDKIKILYLMNKERGEDSCGFSDNIDVLKDLGDSESFINKVINGNKFPKTVKNFIGHTRLATKGGITRDNAHPFKFDSLVGTHNGTIDNFKMLQGIFGTKYSVDSEFVYYLLTKYKLEQVLPLLQGALALAYYDNDNVLTLYRWERPLFYGFDQTNDKTFWYSSKKEYLEAIDCVDIEELPVHTVMKVKDGEIQDIGKLPVEIEPILPECKYNYKSFVPPVMFKDIEPFLLDLGDESLNMESPFKEKPKSGSHKNLYSEIPQYATVKRYNGIIYSWWFDAKDYDILYVKRGRGAIDLLDLDDESDFDRLFKWHPSISSDVWDRWVELDDSMALRIQEGI